MVITVQTLIAKEQLILKIIKKGLLTNNSYLVNKDKLK